MIRVADYVQFVAGGKDEYHISKNIKWVRDKDLICWRDFLSDLDVETPRASNQTLTVTYWNKVKGSYEEIVYDSTLLAALDMYWEIRRLVVNVVVNDPPVQQKIEMIFSQNTIATPDIVPESLSHSTQPPGTSKLLECEHDSIVPAQINDVPSQSELVADTNDVKPSLDVGMNDAKPAPAADTNDAKPAPAADGNEAEPAHDDNDWGVNDEVEYVGVDDEKSFHGDLVYDDDSDSDFIPS